MQEGLLRVRYLTLKQAVDPCNDQRQVNSSKPEGQNSNKINKLKTFENNFNNHCV